MKKKLLRLTKMCSYYTLTGILAQVIFLNLAFASDLSAQKVKSIEEVYVGIELKNAKLEEAFREIEAKTRYRFAYEKRDLDKNIRISLNTSGSTLKDVLLQISKEASLRFRQVNYDIDVKKIYRDRNIDNSERIQVFQGGRKISGRVISSEDNSGLPGVNVIVKGTDTGTVTDINGDYSVDVPSESTILVFSSIGYISEEIQVGNQSVIDVTMQPDITELSEIVVVGYGQVEARDATGAVTSIKSEDFNRGVISSPEQLIQGKTAGVQITSSSGEPGAGINIRIRGTSSVRSNNNPLFVVDGVPLSGNDVSAGLPDIGLGTTSAKNPLNFLNPNDIASIDILKDASATAIYGSRGANGVVIITTKSGKGRDVLNYSYSVGVSNISKKYDLLSADEYLDAYADFHGTAAAQELDGGADTDWQDEIFRTAMTHQHNLSFGGGDESTDYRFSVSYMDQEGIVESSGLTRYTARFNGSKSFIDDRLTIATQLTIANTRDDNVPITDNSGFEGDLLGAALKANPTLPVRNSDGELVQPGPTEPNPVAMLVYAKDFTNTMRALGNISAELEIVEGLSFKTVVGLDRSMSTRRAAFSSSLVAPGIEDKGRLFTNDIEMDNMLWENYFTYDKTVGNVKINAVLGYSYQSFDRSTNTTESTNFRSSDLDIMINNWASANQNPTLIITRYTAEELDTAANPELKPLVGEIKSATLDPNSISIVGRNSTKETDELQSYFGRFNIGLSDKYLLTLTLRADGSTKFGSGNKYGYFPSAAFKWRLADESFAPEVFSDLSFRVGYGITGNQEIPHNLYQPRQRYNDWDIVTGGTISGGGLGSVAFANPNLKWESTSQLSIGLEYGFMNNRISGSIDYYYKNTNDLLIQITSAQPAVQPFVWTNLDADVVNEGLEFLVSAAVVDGEDFQWNVDANVAYNKNEVRNFGGLINTGTISGQGLTGAFAQRIAEGQPLFAYFLRDFAGFDQEGISIYNDGDFQQFTGDSPLPTTTAGLTNTFTYKNLDLSIFLTGQFGHSVYNNTANAYFTAGSLANGRNVSKDIVGNGESNLNAPDVSTRFLEKADFIRLQNASIGYRINTSNINAISDLRIFVTGQNLFVITDYSGQDPEVNVNKALEGVPSLGIDYTPYPRARTFMFGVNVSF